MAKALFNKKQKTFSPANWTKIWRRNL